MSRYLTLILGGAAVIVAIIVAAILIRNTFKSGGSAKEQPIPDVNLTTAVTTNTMLRMRVDGPVVANENRESVQIDVGPRSRTAAFFKTYRDTAVRRSNYDNNDRAFEEFVRALQKAGFTKERKGNPYDGECAVGRVYHFDTIENSETVKSLWLTSCQPKGPLGTFGGNAVAVIDLFKKQVPDYVELTAGATLFNQ